MKKCRINGVGPERARGKGIVCRGAKVVGVIHHPKASSIAKKAGKGVGNGRGKGLRVIAGGNIGKPGCQGRVLGLKGGYKGLPESRGVRAAARYPGEDRRRGPGKGQLFRGNGFSVSGGSRKGYQGKGPEGLAQAGRNAVPFKKKTVGGSAHG